LSIKRLIGLSQTEVIFFKEDGGITILNTEQLLETTRTGSVFQLKSEDYKDFLFIKAKENFFFTIESQKMEFFTMEHFKKSDTWDYYLPYALIGCDKNEEGSKICVWDSNSTLTMFNFLTPKPDSKKHQPPAHKRSDLIQCLDMTERKLISCSLERELKIWDINTNKFLRKFDLASFT
jgi:WD40 repeat protein